jgi:FdhE protein
VIETTPLNHHTTLYRAGSLFTRDMDISAISLIHMDMIMQEKSYTPMSICVWNSLI